MMKIVAIGDTKDIEVIQKYGGDSVEIDDCGPYRVSVAREHAAALARILQHFADHGTLPDRSDDAK